MNRITTYLSIRWQRTLFILFFAQMMTAVGFSSVFPFLPLYVDSLGSSTDLSVEFLSGMVYSAQGFSMMIASPVWGVLADRYGRKLMVERAMFGGSVLLLLMAFVQSAEQLVLLRTIQGLITGTVSAASALIAAEAPRKHMGSAMGTLQVGLAGGVAIGPVIGGAIADLYGYRVAFFVTAGLLFISGVAVLFGVKENFSSLANEDFKPRTFIAEWRRVITTPGVLTSYSMRFTSQLGRMMIIPIIPLFISILLVDQSGVNTFTGIVVGVASGTSTISAIYLGRVGDRVGHKKVVIACSLVAALVYIPQSMVTAGWQLLIFQALIGISLGGIIPTISALLARYTQSGEEGAVYGLDNAINAGSRAVAPILGSGVALLFGMRATFIGTALFFLLVGLLGIWLLPQNT